VVAVRQHLREGGPPRTAPNHDDSHERWTKSIETGTPSRLNRLRSSFSTQYA
jgi:hypothetical protein